MRKERFDCFLRVISPVHIGCEEVYEPMSFVMDEMAQKIIAFDPISFFKSLNQRDKQRFSEICMKGTISSLLEMYKFLRGRKVQGRSIKVCKGLVEHYKKTLSIPIKNTKRIQQELNRFEIKRTSFLTNDEKPYIPGSSVKGALRTAYLNKISKKKKIQIKGHKISAKKLEELLLEGRFYTDPFRMVKVSDFRPLKGVKTKIVYAINQKKHKQSGTARGPYQILEVIEPGSVFYGSIEVCIPEKDADIKNPVKLDELLRNTDEFYKKQKKREIKELKNVPLHSVKIPENGRAYLLRIGRHSGVESITIEDYRVSDATTVWLASEFSKFLHGQILWPFGWVCLVKAEKELLEKEEPEQVLKKEIRQDGEPLEKEPENAIKEDIEIWENATVIWDPGSQVVTAHKEGRKAIAKGKDIVPEHLHKKLFTKKRMVKATVEVEVMGNLYKIIKIN